jgi:hypothetical protein
LIMVTIEDLVRHRLANDIGRSVDVGNQHLPARRPAWVA